MVMNISKDMKCSFEHLGDILIIFGLILIIPVFIALIYSETTYNKTIIYLGYLFPSFLSIITGTFLKTKFEAGEINLVQGLFLTAISWIIISFFGSLPFVLLTDLSILNAYFESVSGFTTTGMTMLTEISSLPKSLIFWRSMTQWVGGLGIITFFLFIGGRGISEHSLFRGETHGAFSERPVPNMKKTIKIFWAIYCAFTFSMAILLWLEGTTFFDGITHAFTTLSTGGFSPYDSSIEFYRISGFENYRLIEYTTTFFMLLGGTSFVIHYRLLNREINSLWDTLQAKSWLILLIVSVFIIFINIGGYQEIEATFRNTVFQVVSIATTTGYQTQYIGSSYFPATAKQIFLILMIIGGCTNSTGGGIKVKRLALMIKGIFNRIKRISRPKRMLTPLIVDGNKVEEKQLERIFVVFTTWMLLLVIGGMITSFFSTHDPYSSFSGMFSAIGNIGPSFLSVQELINLNPVIKIFYMFGMLLGRLEIIPVLVLFNKEIWKK